MRRRLLVIISVLVLVVAACSGSGDDGTGDNSPDPTPTSGSEDGSGGSDNGDDGGSGDDTPTDSGDETSSDGIGTATVTIGDTTYEFAPMFDGPGFQCNPDFFGGFFVVATDGPVTQGPNSIGASLGISGETPEVTLRVESGGDADIEWIADAGKYDDLDDLPEGIGVTDFSIDGNTASGTGVFFNENSYWAVLGGVADEVEVASGSFEITCNG